MPFYCMMRVRLVKIYTSKEVSISLSLYYIHIMGSANSNVFLDSVRRSLRKPWPYVSSTFFLPRRRPPHYVHHLPILTDQAQAQLAGTLGPKISAMVLFNLTLRVCHSRRVKPRHYICSPACYLKSLVMRIVLSMLKEKQEFLRLKTMQ